MLQEDVRQPYAKQSEFRNLTRDLSSDEVAPPTRSRDGDCPLRPTGSPRLDLQDACVYGTDKERARGGGVGGGARMSKTPGCSARDRPDARAKTLFGTGL